jgi:hypothetical protein
MKNKIKRRSFIGTSAMGIAGAGLLASSSFNQEENDVLGTKFIHQVYFWLKEPGSQEGRKRFEEGLKALVNVETIQNYHLGVPAGTSRDVIDATYTYSLLTVFKNREDQDIYQTHPIHLKFIEDCNDLWERVVVYDSVSI